MLVTGLIIGMIVAVVGVAVAIQRQGMRLVPEDYFVITVDRHGFIKRVLPAGRYLLLSPLERVELTLPTKTSLTGGWVPAVVTSDALSLKINWSGTYALRPDLITDNRSQRLRGLPNAEKAIARNVDLGLRRLIGDYPATELFNPAVRDRLERQLSQFIADKLAPLGVAVNGLNLQTIELPADVAEALNKAKAIATLDNAIRQLDPTTREVVRGVYQLDEILHWDQYLPIPTRQTMHKAQITSNS